jgi:hypothetical protein
VVSVIRASAIRQTLPLLFLFPQIAWSHTWIIFPDGTGDFGTIQAAIDASGIADTVFVRSGTYYEALDFKGKPIVILGEASSTTILDGSQLETHLVTFKNGETTESVLEGFTIRLSRANAVYCSQASPTIRNNRFVDDLDPCCWGGAILAVGSPIIEQNIFEANESGGNGGCMALTGGSPIVRKNIFRDNRSRLDGGAILVDDASGECRIEGNEFWDNVAGDHGGAMEIWSSFGSVSINNNLFVRNVAKGNDGSGDTGTGGCLSVRGASNIFIENNTFVLNSSINWAACSGGTLLIDDDTNCRFNRNIIASSEECAVSCHGQFTGEFQDNLFWGNVPTDISANCQADLAHGSLSADPLFCDPESGDYRVAHKSPALTGPVQIGAFVDPACDKVPVTHITWGFLKARFSGNE